VPHIDPTASLIRNTADTIFDKPIVGAISDSYIDWTDCELVERVPGKVSGRPLVRGTRILADTVVQDAELVSPLEEIHENYPMGEPGRDRQGAVECRLSKVGRA